MATTQSDLSDEALILAIRSNLCGFFRHFSVSRPDESFEHERFTRWRSPIPHPWFNGVLCSQPPAAEDELFIDEVIKYFREKNTRAFTWWIEPPVQSPAWELVLAKRGFGFSDDTPGMAIDLYNLEAVPARVDGLEIRFADDENLLRTWVETFARGYGLPLEWTSMIFDVWRALGLEHPIRNYLGYLDGDPVATSSIFFSGEVVGIYDVATLPNARSKGIGAAMTLHPLLEEREKGKRIGTLQSSAMGFNVYKRIGFRHLCQIDYFYLSL
jgi:GNAT superfamily N-acetyltransferase